MKFLSCVRLFATPWTTAFKAPLSTEFPSQEYWSGLPFSSRGDLPHPGIEPRSPTLQADTLPSEPPGKPHVTKVVLKSLQARLQQCMNQELPDIQTGFRKGRGTRDQIASIHQIIEKARELKKKICFCFIYYAKAFDCVNHKKLWKILKEMGIPDHPTCLLRNLYAGQEVTVGTRHITMDWFKLGKECIRAVYCHSVYLAYMQSTSCKSQAG